ncbi:hypothetical protein BG74_05050 [Sodalis-like endosymbiont of Proechinophthirus fluctus]|nr:hypothetical protein BG74_05050 [Sodalis-like endosymbiont of Proechinophthirus fluctus]
MRWRGYRTPSGDRSAHWHRKNAVVSDSGHRYRLLRAKTAGGESTANVTLQDQIFSKDMPLLRKLIPDLTFIVIFGRRRYICPQNLAVMAADGVIQGDLLLFIDDPNGPARGAEHHQCVALQKSLSNASWDGLRNRYPQL